MAADDRGMIADKYNRVIQEGSSEVYIFSTSLTSAFAGGVRN